MRKAVVILSLIVIAIIVILALTDRIGISANSIEKDARHSQRINGTYHTSLAIEDRMAVALFYDDAKADYTYAIYVKGDKLSYGYFFKAGGSSTHIDSGIKGISFENNGMALLSINKPKINRIEMQINEDVEITNIDPEKPFVLVVPDTVDSIELFNEEGKSVPIDIVEAY